MTTPAPVATDVAIVPWPTGAVARARARAAGAPCLLVVEPGAPPPTDCGIAEDWTPADAPAADIARRADVLATRVPDRPAAAAPADLDDDEVLLFDVLDRHHPQAASWASITAALPADGVAATLATLRRRLRPHGYEVLRVPGGVLLAVAPYRTR